MKKILKITALRSGDDILVISVTNNGKKSIIEIPIKVNQYEVIN